MKKTIKVFFHLLIIFFISWTISFFSDGNYWEQYFYYLYLVITNNAFVRPAMTIQLTIFIFPTLSVIYFLVKKYYFIERRKLFFVYYLLFIVFYLLSFIFCLLFALISLFFADSLNSLFFADGFHGIFFLFYLIFAVLFLLSFSYEVIFKSRKLIPKYTVIILAIISDFILRYIFFNGTLYLDVGSPYYQDNWFLIPLVMTIIQLIIYRASQKKTREHKH